MKKIIITILLLSIPMFLSLAQSDSIMRENIKSNHGEVGLSFGRGLGLDFGLGRVTKEDAFHQRGIIFLASVYVPYYGRNNPDKFGMNVGLKYIINRFSFGIMSDWLREVRHSDYYQNSVRYTSDHVSNKWGAIITTSFQFSSRWNFSVFAGTRRSVMLGLLLFY
jgi:hypothetical protein